MLLQSQFGELCTMCEALVACRVDPFQDPAEVKADLSDFEDQEFTLYHFKTKDFWGQIATIWDYFAVWIDPVTSEKRPVRVYQHFDPQNGGPTLRERTAFLSVQEAKITVLDQSIDRWSGERISEDGDEQTYCVRLSLRDVLPQLDTYATWQMMASGE